MTDPKVTRLLVGISVAALVVVELASLAAAKEFHSKGNDHSSTAVVAAATARFHNLEAAKAAGYTAEVTDTAGNSCIADPEGGMGIHWANPNLLGDAVVDPTHPEALVYAPNTGGRPKLAAVEYIVFANAWADAGHAEAPSLFGQQFQFTRDDPPNRFGIPAFWSLHVWIWRPNPAGMFAMWNPDVHC